jgi:hypothetical protein
MLMLYRRALPRYKSDMPPLGIPEALLRGAVAALRPYGRRMLDAGVTFGQLEALLRELFVEIAEQQIVRSGAVPTDSRISILTGINRKEVHRIRSAGRDAAPRAFSRNLAASLISRWMSDPRTTDGAGRPLPLPYGARRGPSFVGLVRKVTADLHPRALLDALIDAGAAVLHEGDVVALNRTAYLPQRGRPEALAMLADDPPELIETMLHNVLGSTGEPHLQQKLAYDNIGSDGLPALRLGLRREAERFLARANALLLRHDRDRAPRAPQGRRTAAGIGVYYFEAPDESDPPRESSAPATRKRIRKRRSSS